MFKYKVFVNIFLISLFVYIIVMISSTIIIDPYAEVNLFINKYNKLKINSSYNTVPFKLYELLKKDKYILVFGTSRSQFINSNMAGEKVLNFSSSLYGNPKDIFEFLNQLEDKQIANSIEIWYLVDTHTFAPKNSIYEKINLDSKVDFVKQILSDFNYHRIMSMFKTIDNNINNNCNYYITRYGENYNINEIFFDGNINVTYYRIPSFDKNSIDYLRKIDLFCKNKKIKIKYFTPLYNIPYLQFTNLDKYYIQYMHFLEAVDFIYDFHYIDKLSNNLNLFSNYDHVNTLGTTELVKLLKDQNILNEFKVNKANIEKHFKDINSKIRKKRIECNCGIIQESI